MSPFEQSRAILSDGQTFGVWSLIVTFFGDMAQGPDDRVSGTALTALCEKLGIKPQAMRVALHRLRKDGWIDSVKTGRRSAYFLTNASRTESAKATAQIYASAAPLFTGYHLLVAPTDLASKLKIDGWISVGPELFLNFETESNAPENTLISRHQQPVPDWLCKRLVHAETVQEYQNFGQKLKVVSGHQWSHFSAYESVALRVLLVHAWRRLVLRHAEFPAEAFPANCPVSDCYEGMSELLSKLPRPDLTALE